MNPYETLGVEPGASDKEIKSAFKKLAKKHHPDVGGDEQKFKEINEAYSILTGKQEQPQPDFGFRSGGNPFGAFFDEAIFNSIFRGGNNRMVTRISVDPEMLLKGGSFEYQHQVFEHRGGRVYPQMKTVTIKVEPDATVGMQIAVPGSQPTHIFLQLIPGNTERYQVDEMFNLTESYHINAFKAMCGGEIEVTLPAGKTIKLKVPAGTQNNTIHRVKMAGLRVSANGSRSDYNIRFIVDVPTIEGTSEEGLKEKMLESMKEGLK